MRTVLSIHAAFAPAFICAGQPISGEATPLEIKAKPAPQPGDRRQSA